MTVMFEKGETVVHMFRNTLKILVLFLMILSGLVYRGEVKFVDYRQFLRRNPQEERDTFNICSKSVPEGLTHVVLQTSHTQMC